MRKFIQNKLKDQKGLTLIELLAVIVILAIIAAIAIPAIGNVIENSRYGAIKSDAVNILAASDVFYADGNVGTTATEVTVSELKSGGYLENAGSFEADAASTKVVKAVAGTTPVAAKFTGKAVVGSVKLTFVGATRSQINTISKANIPVGTTAIVATQ